MHLRLPSLLVYPVTLISFFNADIGYAQVNNTEKAVEQVATQQVIIKAISSNDRADDTASKTIVRQGEIQRYGDLNLIDVLKRLPGISADRDGIQMRGLGDGYVQILLDGQPLPPGMDIDAIAVDSIERIEITRSASAELSTRAIAGTVNIILKRIVRPNQKDLKIGAARSGPIAPFASLQMSERSGGVSYTLSAAATGSASDTTAVTASSMHQTDVMAGDSITQRRGQFESKSLQLAPRISWQPSKNDTLTLQNFSRYLRSNSNGTEVVDVLSGNASPYDMAGHDNDTNSSTISNTLNWLHTMPSGDTFDIKASTNWTRRDSALSFSSRTGTGQNYLQRNTHLYTSDQSVSINLKYTARKKGHELSWGMEWHGAKRKDQRLQRDLLLDLAPRETLEKPNIEVMRNAMFIQDEWAVTPAWSVYAGLRREQIKTSATSDHLATANNTSSVTSPVLQTLWKAGSTGKSQWRLALARTYKSAPLTSLLSRKFISVNNSAIRPDYEGNAVLRPELAWGLDTSFEHHAENNAVLALRPYWRKISNIVGSKLSLRDGRWVSTPANNGNATAHGLEIEAKFPLTALFDASPAIDISLNAGRNWSRVREIDGPDNRIEGQIPITGSFGMDWKLSRLPATLGASLTYRGKSSIESLSGTLNQRSANLSIDMYGTWQLNQSSKLRLAAANLHPKDEYNLIRYGQSGISTDNTLTRNDTTIRLILEYKYR